MHIDENNDIDESYQKHIFIHFKLFLHGFAALNGIRPFSTTKKNPLT